MKLLESFIGSPVAGAIGWTLLHSLWEGAIITGAHAAVLVLVRTSRALCRSLCSHACHARRIQLHHGLDDARISPQRIVEEVRFHNLEALT
jgi:hypothetical protein